ncbi:30S ribosomal protein S16 [Salpingoeca rosetta]|uniref:30S ribosomal protein S16 n=1 Tax=Salpingoeca rosetta (strain ATCC 50818 / BSB-021) TaxID=946362 RepID=F2UF94_SALR5|nr:30S ribosomal protein S16 [Salpingoeca rosetta]EGD75294.1 30S ribosomal protein S16 [Salpingoeca rosetta]|eukprot:XP_004992347.1 30S ribosomal protein S16 [Salpingoeca rosetta]
MVVAMRLQRFGSRHSPFYRIVVANRRAPRDGKFIERVGTYNPFPRNDMTKVCSMNFDRIKYWLSVGAQPSDRVSYLLGLAGILPPHPNRHLLKGTPPASSEETQSEE